MRTCAATVYTEGYDHRCCNPAKYEHEGKWFCGIHYPPKAAERAAAKKTRWKKEWDDRQARWKAEAERDRRAALCVAACEGVPDEKLTPGIVARLMEGN